MKRAASGLIAGCGLLLLLGSFWTTVSDCELSANPALAQSELSSPASAPPALPPASTATDTSAESIRGTTWVVLRVSKDDPELVAKIHKDALPYAPGPPTADANGVRFRLLSATGEDVTGPCSWPRLCPCEKTTSHTQGCVRKPHSGSVRLRLPRIHGPSTVLLERRVPTGWASFASLEVDA